MDKIHFVEMMFYISSFLRFTDSIVKYCNTIFKRKRILVDVAIYSYCYIKLLYFLATFDVVEIYNLENYPQK